MLAHRSECQRREYDADGRARKARAFRKYLRNINIEKKEKSVKPRVHKAQGHAVFLREVALVAGVLEQDAQPFESLPVEEPARRDAGDEQQDKKDIGERRIRPSVAVVDRIRDDDPVRRVDPHRLIQEIEHQKTEKAVGESAVVEVIALVPGLDARQDGRRDDRDDQKESEREHNAPECQGDFPGNITGALRIPEEKLRDERAEAGREHAHMQVLVEIQIPDLQIQERREKTGQHI